jgi:hypothetical protein
VSNGTYLERNDVDEHHRCARFQDAARVALALALTPAERAYLFELAGRRDPDAPPTRQFITTPDSVSALVTALPFPAYGLERLWNACFWNAGAGRLFAGWLGTGEQRNLLRYTLTSSKARTLIPDWEGYARRILAEFRADCARMLSDPDLDALVNGLREEYDLFAREWDSQSVSAREGGLRRCRHSDGTFLHFDQHNFQAAERPDYKLVVLVPA